MPPVAWPALQDVYVINYLLVGIAVVFVGVMATMGKWAKRFGIGFASVIGQSTAGVLFFVLGTVGLFDMATYVPPHVRRETKEQVRPVASRSTRGRVSSGIGGPAACALSS